MCKETEVQKRASCTRNAIKGCIHYRTLLPGENKNVVQSYTMRTKCDGRTSETKELNYTLCWVLWNYLHLIFGLMMLCAGKLRNLSLIVK